MGRLQLCEPASADRPATMAPSLPSDGHLASAAMAAERLRLTANALTAIIQNSPRDMLAVRQVHGEILDAWLSVSDGLDAFQAVISCEGQA